jgi:succinoglycan biosynthesis protein ExoM
MLLRLLQALERQQIGEEFTFSVVVADNDSAESARESVERFSRRSSLRIIYCVEPKQNIALARNQALANSNGDFVAFIDDDEFPAADWLQKLLSACEQYHADGVLGPVRPHFELPPPPWIIRGRFCERPEHGTGRVMKWDECRTGNFLFRRHILDSLGGWFKPEFGTGGEDKDFFMRLTQRGRTFVWCNEAIAYETVPPSRCTRGYMLKRALLRGRNIVKHPVGRMGLLARSVVAVPIYSLALPALLLLGQHWFMRYCIKLCDHLGRVLAILGVNPIGERQL